MYIYIYIYMYTYKNIFGTVFKNDESSLKMLLRQEKCSILTIKK